MIPSVLGSLCQAVGVGTKSASGIIWLLIKTLWPWYWLGIIAALIIWSVFEFATRSGSSANGLSPVYNKFIGNGLYLLSQWLVNLGLVKAFGDVAYCEPFSYIAHITAFLAVGFLLNVTGIWVYWRLPRF